MKKKEKEQQLTTKESRVVSEASAIAGGEGGRGNGAVGVA